MRTRWLGIELDVRVAAEPSSPRRGSGIGRRRSRRLRRRAQRRSRRRSARRRACRASGASARIAITTTATSASAADRELRTRREAATRRRRRRRPRRALPGLRRRRGRPPPADRSPHRRAQPRRAHRPPPASIASAGPRRAVEREQLGQIVRRSSRRSFQRLAQRSLGEPQPAAHGLERRGDRLGDLGNRHADREVQDQRLPLIAGRRSSAAASSRRSSYGDVSPGSRSRSATSSAPGWVSARRRRSVANVLRATTRSTHASNRPSPRIGRRARAAPRSAPPARRRRRARRRARGSARGCARAAAARGTATRAATAIARRRRPVIARIAAPRADLERERRARLHGADRVDDLGHAVARHRGLGRAVRPHRRRALRRRRSCPRAARARRPRRWPTNATVDALGVGARPARRHDVER